jgi:hypothetical protein
MSQSFLLPVGNCDARASRDALVSHGSGGRGTARHALVPKLTDIGTFYVTREPIITLYQLRGESCGQKPNWLIPRSRQEARMEIQRIIAELREERARLDEAISALEKVALTQKPRRGRPPAWTKGSGLDEPEGTKTTRNSKDATSHLTAKTN